MTGHPFTQVLRTAAGYGSTPEPERERPLGDIIGGRVPGPAVMRPRPTSNEEINRSIRGAARLVRAAQLHGGVNLADVAHADLWRTRA